MINLLSKALLTILLVTAVALAQKDRLVTIKADHTDLGRVLRSLVRQMDYNIYLSPGLKGEVTTDLSNVPGFGALELILKTQPDDLTYKVVGNTIVVGPPNKIGRISSDLLNR